MMAPVLMSGSMGRWSGSSRCPTRSTLLGVNSVDGAARVLTSILGLAPSAYPRIPWELAPAPIPGSVVVEVRRIALAEGLAAGSNDGNNAHEC